MMESILRRWFVVPLLFAALASADDFYDDDDEDFCYYDDVGDWSKCDPLLKRQFMKQVIVSGGPSCLKEQTINRTCVPEKTKMVSIKTTETPTTSPAVPEEKEHPRPTPKEKKEDLKLRPNAPISSPKTVNPKKVLKGFLFGKKPKEIQVTTPSWGYRPPLPPNKYVKHRKPNPRKLRVYRKPNPPFRQPPHFKGKPANIFAKTEIKKNNQQASRFGWPNTLPRTASNGAHPHANDQWHAGNIHQRVLTSTVTSSIGGYAWKRDHPPHGGQRYDPPHNRGEWHDHPPHGPPPHGHPPHGAPPFGHPPHGHPPQGHPPQGHPTHGPPPFGHPPEGHPPHGPPPFGHPPHGHPPHGPPPFGHPPHGDPPHGPPPFGHATHGQPPYGHQPYRGPW